MNQDNKTEGKNKLKRCRVLKTWDEYFQILCQGKKTEDKDLAIFYSRKYGKLGRVGILVPKRLGKAVERNRIKRLLRESYRLNQELFSSGMDIAIRAKRNICHLSLKEMSTKLKKLWKYVDENSGRIKIG